VAVATAGEDDLRLWAMAADRVALTAIVAPDGYSTSA